MKLLLGTHSFLWFITGSANLSSTARGLIEDPANERLLSMASLWEMAIKVSIGKLTLGQPFDQLIPSQLQANSIDILDIKVPHISKVVTLPFHHKDPFDRLLVAQCLVEPLPLISNDTLLDSYGIQRLW